MNNKITIDFEEYKELQKIAIESTKIVDLEEAYKKEKYLVDKLTRQLTDEYKNTEYQCKEKEKYKNIIKEVREYIKNNLCKDDNGCGCWWYSFEYYVEAKKELLEILDKEDV